MAKTYYNETMNNTDDQFKTTCPQVNCGQGCGCSPFRKVVITASQGTDEEGEPFAPENGAYQNALVQYEANGAIYIYSSDGIFTKIV